MLQKAEQSGELTHDKVIIEATSGNTGMMAKVATEFGLLSRVIE